MLTFTLYCFNASFVSVVFFVFFMKWNKFLNVNLVTFEQHSHFLSSDPPASLHFAPISHSIKTTCLILSTSPLCCSDPLGPLGYRGAALMDWAGSVPSAVLEFAPLPWRRKPLLSGCAAATGDDKWCEVYSLDPGSSFDVVVGSVRKNLIPALFKNWSLQLFFFQENFKNCFFFLLSYMKFNVWVY